MGMAAPDNVGSGINGRVAHGNLIRGGTVDALETPVQGSDNDIRPLLLQRCNAAADVGSGGIELRVNADAGAILTLVEPGAAVRGPGDLHPVQRGLGIRLALGKEVPGVVVRQRHELDAALGKHGGIGRVGTESKGRAVGDGRCGKGSLHVGHGEIIIREILLRCREGEGIIRPHNALKGGCGAALVLAAADGAVADEAEHIILRFRLRRGRRTGAGAGRGFRRRARRGRRCERRLRRFGGFRRHIHRLRRHDPQYDHRGQRQNKGDPQAE